MDITAISDLHGHYPKLDGGDLLIVAGDLTKLDTHTEYLQFLSWLHKQDYKHYVFIAGNHDSLIQKGHILTSGMANTSYLCDSGTEFEWLETEDTKWGARHLPGCRSLKLKIWGSPWTKRFEGMNPHCMAFTVETEEELADKWKLIPDDVDILVTHSPPYDLLDHIKTPLNDREPVGSYSLYCRVTNIYPKLHIFGHIHEGYGSERRRYFPGSDDITLRWKDIEFINASHVNEHYKPVNKPIRIEL